MPASLPFILIVGPTAGGKTRLAIDIARALPEGGECICADSMQIYRGMDIGTAKPTAEEQAAAVHHLLDLVEPTEQGFSVDVWLDLARRTIDEVRARGCRPIVVGGTNLYVQALLFGLTGGPAPDDALRRRLREQSPESLRAWLERVDPGAAERIHLHDTKRTVRAIEVHELTGRPMSEQQADWTDTPPRDDVRLLGLEYTPEAINRRINTRVRAMLKEGLIEEVTDLYRAGRLGPQAAEALGYRQIVDVLEDRRSLEEAIEEIRIRTRRFGKQQRTWLRRFRQVPGSIWIRADDMAPETILQQALTAIRG